jgi:hypothetical protein
VDYEACELRNPGQVRGFEILPSKGTDQRQIGNSSSQRPGVPDLFLACSS